jgi:hypothetical protein
MGVSLRLDRFRSFRDGVFRLGHYVLLRSVHSDDGMISREQAALDVSGSIDFRHIGLFLRYGEEG